MKKAKAISSAAILFSGMMLGSTITAPIIAPAAQVQASSDQQVSNTIVYSRGNIVVGTEKVSGPIGYKQAVVAPAGFKLANPANPVVTLKDGVNTRLIVQVLAAPQSAPLQMKVNYIDSATNRTVSSQTLKGNEGDSVSLTVPDLYNLNNTNDNQLTLAAGLTYRNVYVTKTALEAGEVSNTVKYRIDHSAQYVGIKHVSGKAGSQGSYEAPEGYKLAPKQSSIFFLSPTDTIHIAVVEKDTDTISTKVNYVDVATGAIVGKSTVSGNYGQTVTVNFPSDYSPVTDTDRNIVIKPGQVSKNILVSKTASKDTASSNENITGNRGTLFIKSPNGATLYGKDGKSTGKSARTLKTKTDWAMDQKMTKDGVVYYRVSSNEWVKASDVVEYSNESKTITTDNSGAKHLYSADGSQSQRSLSGNTSWHTDRSANINGSKMYRVSTDEWIKASDVK